MRTFKINMGSITMSSLAQEATELPNLRRCLRAFQAILISITFSFRAKEAVQEKTVDSFIPEMKTFSMPLRMRHLWISTVHLSMFHQIVREGSSPQLSQIQTHSQETMPIRKNFIAKD